ncbi:MAG: FAD-binding protein [Parachlamydiales bacterium]|nr:FAD-binding protein [Parachlamydiales bacterium]
MQYDCIIIGTGLSGSIAAYILGKRGFRVALFSSQKNISDSNSSHAQGGIVYRGEGDSPELLFHDIMRAGQICDRKALLDFTIRAPLFVEEFLIRELNVPFDRIDKNFSLALEGGHSMPRILHCCDRTGKIIMTYLAQALEKISNVQLFLQHQALELIKHNDRCVGVWIRKQTSAYAYPFFAPETILATGGVGRLFCHTTNPLPSLGEGIGMAAHIGAELAGLEYVQFHPTALYSSKDRFLISEAMRGAGARLFDVSRQPFMHQYHEQKDLAPRDIVAKAILQQMNRDQTDHVWLSICHQDSAYLRKRFPWIYEQCMQRGFDLTQEDLPVVPAAHYHVGGIRVDSCGCTNIQGLRAAGEVAFSGIHGANRLASTSLLEALYLGVLAAQNIPMEEKIENGLNLSRKKVRRHFSPSIIQTVQNMMWQNVGVKRSKEKLFLAVEQLSFLYEQLPMHDFFVERNFLKTAYLIALAAYSNPKSCGCHFVE